MLQSTTESEGNQPELVLLLLLLLVLPLLLPLPLPLTVLLPVQSQHSAGCILRPRADVACQADDGFLKVDWHGLLLVQLLPEGCAFRHGMSGQQC